MASEYGGVQHVNPIAGGGSGGGSGSGDGGGSVGGSAGGFDLSLLGWYDLRDSLLAAEAVTLAAQNRTESRGAHVREDFPAVDPKFEQNQAIGLGSAGLAAAWEPVTRQ